MRAACYYGPGDVRVEDIEEPVTGPGQVKVRVAYNGICGTDLHEYYHGPRMVPVGAPNPVSGAQAPVVLGHEAAGFVTEIGPGVVGAAVGDLVAIEPLISCGSCGRCARGQYNLCPSGLFHGLNTGGGGLSELTVVPAAKAHRVPAGVSPAEAAIVEPMAVAYHGVHRASPGQGQTAVVHGAGPIGIGAFFALRRLGVETIVVEPCAARRAAAARIGAGHVIDPSAADPVAAIMDLTGGHGADVSIDAVGVEQTFATALATTGAHGDLVVIGVGTDAFRLPLASLLGQEVRITGSMTYAGDFPAVIDAVAAGAYPVAEWTTIISLDDIVTGGFEPLSRGEEIKVLVEMAMAP